MIMRRSVMTLLLSLVLVAGLSGTARAQDRPTVPVGGVADVSNGTECAPNTTAQFFLVVGDGAPESIGSVVTDSAGHVEASIDIPSDVPLGPASVVVDCGIAGSVLIYEIELVEESGSSLVLVLIGIAVLAVLVALFLLRRRSRSGDRSDRKGVAMPVPQTASSDAPRADTDVEASADDSVLPPDTVGSPPIVAAPDDDEQHDAGAAPATAHAPATTASDGGGTGDGDDLVDDGADYWLWDVETPRGPARRLACLTESSFHLDEVPASAFPALLERITEEGPQVALSRAFLSVALDDIDAVYRRYSEMRITYRGPSGISAKTVDLGSEVDGVLELLGRRFEIQDVTPASAAQ